LQKLESKYKIATRPISKSESVIQGDKYRFTILTPQLIRLEYQEEAKFEDRATQSIINRDFPTPTFRIVEEEDKLEIYTDSLYLIYDKQPFSKNGLSIKVGGNFCAYGNTWNYGAEIKDLGGTARTLDNVDGEVPLGHGLISKFGFSVIDDSKSIVLEEDGWVSPRENKCIDIYFLGYGREYLTCLKDFYQLCGSTPMVPRYVLGNWWSRFHEYTEEEYRELIKRFEKEEIPFSIAVLDMDWHVTKTNPKYGSGWTGYTWNKEYFPNPEHFMNWLHEKGMHISLNVHPADGVRAHEEMYLEMAKELNIDYENEDTIQFDISSPEFMQAYFKYLHHQNEDMGVDFWWVDWQQGQNSKIEGLDPLWMLNHYHYLDSKRRGKRPLTFSRYAGVGSHRYPIGFSGDSYATWASLDFQPYFTANASNVGYGWWSHDIGGHMHGTKDDEMATRWVQFGVFSPIMRIHSTNNPFYEKEPWKYNLIVKNTMEYFLRLRHQLVPYLYTMNWRFHELGEPLIQPMYYHNAGDQKAYEVPNEYYFGTELIICPITKPMNPTLKLGHFQAWLPEGNYFDFFTGRVYKGDRMIDLYRDITIIPVFAKAGAIIPMVAEGCIENAVDNPENMEIRIYAGADGEIQLFEDNSERSTEDEIRTDITQIKLTWGDKAEIFITNSKKEIDVIPSKRNYTLKLVGVLNTENIIVKGKESNQFEKQYDDETHTLRIDLKDIITGEDVSVIVDTHNCTIAENHIENQIFSLLNNTQLGYDLLETIYKVIKNGKNSVMMLGELQTLGLEAELLGALFEIITAY